jgi:hypothetical protein
MSILGALGRQALELQLERFFTVWAWKWDIQGDSEFGNCFGAFVDGRSWALQSLSL